VKGISENFKCIRNCYKIRIIFKTKNTLLEFAHANQQRKSHVTAQCIYSIPCEYSRKYIGKTGRPLDVLFFSNCWYLEIPLDNRIQHVPRCVHYHAQSLQLETFQNFYVGSGSRTPELYPVSPNWFEYGFIRVDEKFVACCEVTYV
jgi:hypothetical protein